MPRPNEEEFIRKVLQGHEDAINFCRILFYISQIWDDIVDGDKPVSEADRLFAFRALLVDIPKNPFYQLCFFDLIPLFDASITDWIASNQLRAGNERDRQVAYVLRDRVSIILTYCAGVVGGQTWKEQVAPLIHRHVFEEPYQEYRQEVPQPAPQQLGARQDNFTLQPAPAPQQAQPQPLPNPAPAPHTPGFAQVQPQPLPQPNGHDVNEPDMVNGYTNYRAFAPMSTDAAHLLASRLVGVNSSANPTEAGVDMTEIRSFPLERVEL